MAGQQDAWYSQYLLENPYGCVLCRNRFNSFKRADHHAQACHRGKMLKLCDDDHCSRTVSHDGKCHLHQERGADVFGVTLDELQNKLHNN